MSEENASNPVAQPALPLATVQDFESFDSNALLSNLRYIDGYELQNIFIPAGAEAEAVGKAEQARVLKVLGAISGFHFKPEDRASPYGSMVTWSDGRRTLIPSDFSGEQSDVLEVMLPSIAHPGLRARIADVVWLNKKSAAGAAKIAIESYCESIQKLLDGTYRARFQADEEVPLEAADLLLRAVQISHRVTKKGQTPELLIETAEKLYSAAIKGKRYVAFKRIGNTLSNYGLVDISRLAKDAESLVSAAHDEMPMVTKGVWELAASSYGAIKDTESQRRCSLMAVEKTLEMRAQVSTAGAEASWIRTAIGELRSIQGTQEKREELRQVLRQLQEKARDEFGTFSMPMDLTDMRSGNTEVFGKLTLPEGLLQFATAYTSIPINTLRAEALKEAQESPIFSMMAKSHVDEDGRVIAETPGLPVSGEPDEAWYKAETSRRMGLIRYITVGGFIDPARIAMISNYPLSERHFNAITESSPFIPPAHAPIFALGFARLMQGDFVSASHLLVPQLENSLRHVLTTEGYDLTKIKSDLSQEDPSLSSIIEQFRPELEKIFGPDIINEIELLFTYRPGPALRHSFAHGKIGAGHCYHPDTIYACWFIFQLCCLPLIPYWNEHIAPLIEAENI